MLRIDPLHSPLWVSPTRLRFGIERPLVELDHVGRAEELLVEVLQRGIHLDALPLIGAEFGIDEERIAELVATLSPILVASDPVACVPSRVALERTEDWPDDDAGLARLIADAVRRSGAVIVDRSETPDAAVVLAPVVVPPRTALFWMGCHTPMLPVCPAPGLIDIGPLVRPGETACLECIELGRRDADPDRPVLLTQLTATSRVRAMEVDPAAALLTAAAVTTTLLDFAENREADESVADGHLPVDHRPEEGGTIRVRGRGAVSRRAWAPHPRCSCRGLPGIGIAPVHSLDAARRRPRSSAGPRVHG